MATAREQAQPRPDAQGHDVFELDAEMSWESGLVEPAIPNTTTGTAWGPEHHPSLSGETDALRHSRLTSVAAIMAVIYAILFVWNLISPAAALGVQSLLLGIRLAIAIVVAGPLLGRPRLSRGQLKAIEYTLFGSMTLLLCLSQYFVNLEFIQLDEAANVLANEKNGVLQLFVLMVAYAVFIPNDAREVARVVFSMALAPILALALLLERPDAAEVVYQLRTVEHAGSNALYVLIGAGLAIYGAHMLQGLRTQLHEAKRFGQYQLLQLLGAGGMGEVYLAEHRLLKRPCALKLIRSSEHSNPLAQARFEREVRSAARLSHPNTIEIYDFGHTEDGTFYYVMEYLPGMSLGDLVQQFGPLPPGRLIYLLRQACRGLAEAHAMGLVHRDLKPANIFIAVRGGEYDVVKIVDFGLVKLTHDDAPELTTDRTVSGTPMFMSPEQATGNRDLDGRSDLYALGALAYYSLTGHAPFEGETAMAVMVGHARDPVKPPTELRPDIPADLEAVILRCLAKKPQDRYPNVRALAKALGECKSAADWGDGRAEAWWTASADLILAAAHAS